jgi:hypothetical protein
VKIIVESRSKNFFRDVLHKWSLEGDEKGREGRGLKGSYPSNRGVKIRREVYTSFVHCSPHLSSENYIFGASNKEFDMLVLSILPSPPLPYFFLEHSLKGATFGPFKVHIGPTRSIFQRFSMYLTAHNPYLGSMRSI